MNINENYKNDLKKSLKVPLLIELNKKDNINLKHFGLSEAINVYDDLIKEKNNTNVLYIDGDLNYDKDSIVIVETILAKTSSQIQSAKNLDNLKAGIKSGIGFMTGNLFKDEINYLLDETMNEISLIWGENVKDIVEYFYDDSNNKTTNILKSEFINYANSISGKFSDNEIDKLTKKSINLNNNSLKKFLDLSNSYTSDLSALGIFSLVLKLLFTLSKKDPKELKKKYNKLIFVKNPHKLDKNSLAILSLLFSFQKRLKDEDIHLDISVVYSYTDSNFQLNEENNNEIYRLTKKNLDEQRRFTQRYGILERPSTYIPNVAVKSSTFVGRETELEVLSEKYNNFRTKKSTNRINIISADPGIGKTKLVEKFIYKTRLKFGQRVIQLDILNQVGHSSSNTGLTSLKNSIVNESNRLLSLNTLENTIIDKLKDVTIRRTISSIENLIEFSNLYELSTSIRDSVKHDIDKYELIESAKKISNSQYKSSKEKEYQKIKEAILELKFIAYEGRSGQTYPIILFIDDLQWIDNDTSEFILEYLLKNDILNIYIVGTQRLPDANAILKSAKDNITFYKYKIEFLEQILLKKNDLLNQEDIIYLDGFEEKDLIELISKTIDFQNTTNNKIQKDIKLSRRISKNLISNNSQTKFVNTLFAVETINIICDDRFYKNDNKLILQSPLRYNDTLNDFDKQINTIFESLTSKYEKAYEIVKLDSKFEEKFSLMSYAVLEERLEILQEYFDDYGNAVINSLLISSLVGTPFDTHIVNNIIEEIAKNGNLVDLIKDNKEKESKTSLEDYHYMIIEEIYEILSIHLSFNNVYTYKHNLFEVFLEKQLDYKLNKVFEKNYESYFEELLILIINTLDNERVKITKKLNIENINTQSYLLIQDNKYEDYLYLNECGFNVSKKLYSLTKDHVPLVKFMMTIILISPSIDHISSNKMKIFYELSKDIVKNTNKISEDDINSFLMIFSKLDDHESIIYLNEKLSNIIHSEPYKEIFLLLPYAAHLLENEDFDNLNKNLDKCKQIIENTNKINVEDETSYYNMILLYKVIWSAYYYKLKKYQESYVISSETLAENQYNVVSNVKMFLLFYKYRIISQFKFNEIGTIIDESYQYLQGIVNPFKNEIIGSNYKIEIYDTTIIIVETVTEMYKYFSENDLDSTENIRKDLFKFLNLFAYKTKFENYTNELEILIHKIKYNILEMGVKNIDTSNELNVYYIIEQFEEFPKKNIDTLWVNISKIVEEADPEKCMISAKYLINNLTNISLQTKIKVVIFYIISLAFTIKYNFDNNEILKLKDVINYSDELIIESKLLFNLCLDISGSYINESELMILKFINDEKIKTKLEDEMSMALLQLVLLTFLSSSLEKKIIYDEKINHFIFYFLLENKIKFASYSFYITFFNNYILRLNHLFETKNLNNNKLIMFNNILDLIKMKNIQIQDKDLNDFDIFLTNLTSFRKKYQSDLVEGTVNKLLSLNLIIVKE